MSLAATLSQRRPENAPGPYYVDDTCISCGACWRLAPSLLTSHPVHTFAFFGGQPASEEEQELADAALKLCPVSAIHKETS